MGALADVLARSQALGFLGPGLIEEQVAHAEAFVHAIDGGGARRAVDLGSGGGLPGLVLACLLPATSWCLLDGMRRRTAFLLEAVAELDLVDRVQVLTERAEVVGRWPGWRGQADLVVGRGFGPPPVVAECAAPLLSVGGQLVVSEPPDAAGSRWPAEPLAELGLTLEAVVSGPPGFVRLRQRSLAPDRAPRRVGVPAKRPWWPTFHVEPGHAGTG